MKKELKKCIKSMVRKGSRPLEGVKEAQRGVKDGLGKDEQDELRNIEGM